MIELLVFSPRVDFLILMWITQMGFMFYTWWQSDRFFMRQYARGKFLLDRYAVTMNALLDAGINVEWIPYDEDMQLVRPRVLKVDLNRLARRIGPDRVLLEGKPLTAHGARPDEVN